MNHDASNGVELAEIPGQVWTMLGRAVRDRRHAFRTPVLCTADAHDGTPRARTVVLRHADAEARVLRCHTDRRAEKIAEIEREPVVAWHFYDAKARVQVRARATASVHLEGPVFEQAWERTALMSRRCYLAPHTPGTAAEGPSPNLPEDLLEGEPSPERSEGGREHFAVVESVVLEMDWLWLHHQGHRRAKFRWDTGGALVSADWVQP